MHDDAVTMVNDNQLSCVCACAHVSKTTADEKMSFPLRAATALNRAGAPWGVPGLQGGVSGVSRMLVEASLRAVPGPQLVPPGPEPLRGSPALSLPCPCAAPGPAFPTSFPKGLSSHQKPRAFWRSSLSCFDSAPSPLGLPENKVHD